MKQVDWYFDFISPYAYLQSARLAEIGRAAEVSLRPILFAAVLNHWGTIGPAELMPKRRWTYEHCAWLAHRHGIPFRMPRAHPFNPLPLLRLALADSSDGIVSPESVTRLFHFVWVEGHLPTDRAAWDALLAELSVGAERLESTPVKSLLHANTSRALSQDVFGVPTACCENRAFWGFDSTDMLMAWLNDDALFRSDEFARAGNLPVGIQRVRAS